MENFDQNEKYLHSFAELGEFDVVPDEVLKSLEKLICILYEYTVTILIKFEARFF